MFPCLAALGTKLKAFSPLLRPYSVNFAKLDAEKTKQLLQKCQPVVLSVRNSSGDKTMFVRQSRFVNEKYYDELVRIFLIQIN